MKNKRKIYQDKLEGLIIFCSAPSGARAPAPSPHQFAFVGVAAPAAPLATKAHRAPAY